MRDNRLNQPAELSGLFKTIGVTAVVRLNEVETYPREHFLREGIRHYELEFPDCSLPERHIVERYAAALRAEPGTVFTVQSPPSQLAFRPRFPVAYGSRGVGIRLDLALDGALAAYAAMASRLEPTCRVVDDIVVSAFLAARGITVKDVPGFSFDLTAPYGSAELTGTLTARPGDEYRFA